MRKIIFILIILFLCWLLIEIYCRIPNQFEVTKFDIPSKTENIVILFHGIGDSQNTELKAISDQFKIDLSSFPNSQIINYNWSYANSYLKASANGIKIGSILGLATLNYKELKYIRIISHSAGAFIAEAFCEAYKSKGGIAYLEINFLDPFGLKGFSDLNYGSRSHGKCPDFASSMINTDDPTPTTNTMLKYAWNIDVTDLEPPIGFNRSDHYFPPLYFLLSINKDKAKLTIKSHTKYPRNKIIKAKY